MIIMLLSCKLGRCILLENLLMGLGRKRNAGKGQDGNYMLEHAGDCAPLS